MFSRDFTDIKSGESFDTEWNLFHDISIRMSACRNKKYCSADFELVVRFETLFILFFLSHSPLTFTRKETKYKLFIIILIPSFSPQCRPQWNSMTSGQYSFGRRSYRGRIHRMQGWPFNFFFLFRTLGRLGTSVPRVEFWVRLSKCCELWLVLTSVSKVTVRLTKVTKQV